MEGIISMSETSFIGELKNGPEMNPEDNVFQSIWAEYERVILQSLITSFGLDFIVHDQHGGDVDTIHNVREIGVDSQMKYKNAANEATRAQTKPIVTIPLIPAGRIFFTIIAKAPSVDSWLVISISIPLPVLSDKA